MTGTAGAQGYKGCLVSLQGLSGASYDITPLECTQVEVLTCSEAAAGPMEVYPRMD